MGAFHVMCLSSYWLHIIEHWTSEWVGSAANFVDCEEVRKGQVFSYLEKQVWRERKTVIQELQRKESLDSSTKTIQKLNPNAPEP